MEEITAEYSVEQMLAPFELRVTPVATVAAKTDLGRVRENNEDKFEFYVPEEERAIATRGLVFVVCDGMGGHAAGQIASELTLNTFLDVYLNHPSDSAPFAMDAAVTAANRYVYDVAMSVPDRRGMGTTLSALILLQDEVFTVQVGDSRVYRIRGGEISQLTGEHTWVDEAIRQGWVTEEGAKTHKNRHMLLRAVGVEPAVEVEVRTHDSAEGDLYVLCSDGLSNHVSDGQILEVAQRFSPADAVRKLVSMALLDGGSDNCTAMVVRTDALKR